MTLDEGRKHVFYDLCVSVIAKAEFLPPDELQEVIVSLRADAERSDPVDAKALNALAELLAPYIDL